MRAGLALLLALALPCAARAGEPTIVVDDEGRVTARLDAVPLVDALLAIAEAAGASIVLPAGAADLELRVTARLHAVPVERAVTSLLAAHGLAWRVQDEGDATLVVADVPARAVARPALELDGRACRDRGLAALARGDAGSAMLELARAAELDPASTDVVLAALDDLGRDGDLDARLRRLDGLVAGAPHDDRLRFLRGLFGAMRLEHGGEPGPGVLERTFGDLSRVLARAPGHAAARLTLARARMAVALRPVDPRPLGAELERARSDVELVLRAHPELAVGHLVHALVLGACARGPMLFEAERAELRERAVEALRRARRLGLPHAGPDLLAPR